MSSFQSQYQVELIVILVHVRFICNTRVTPIFNTSNIRFRLDWCLHGNCFIVLCVLCESYDSFVCDETIIKY